MRRGRDWMAVVGALVALGCGRTENPTPSAVAPATGAVSPAAVRAAAAPEANPLRVAEGAPRANDGGGLDAVPWSARVGLERALAERDPRHTPRLDEGGAPTLGRGPLTARYDAAGAHVAVGEHTVSLRAVSMGRGAARAPLREAPPTLAGPEVRADRGAALVEWWRSLYSGLEHGVTISERPAGEGELRVELALGGDLRACGSSDDAVELCDAAGTTIALYAHLVAWDDGGERVPARLHAEAGVITIAVDDAGARYPLVVDPLLVPSAEASLAMSGAASADRAGYAVALSGDGSYALVGVPYDDTAAGGTDTGTARVFLRTGTTWAEQATLSPADAERGDVFGYSVALSADGSRALVGANWDSTAAGGTRAGSARVFVRAGTVWTEEARLFAAGGATEDWFGSAVDLDAAGSRALVGAPYDDTAAGADAGSARVFVRTGTTWTEESTLLPPLGAESDIFGSAVSLSADGSRALVGSHWDDGAAGVDTGSAFVFARSGTAWSVEATLTAADAAAEDAFGYAVALSADGLRALVGAPYDDVGGVANAGTIRSFVRDGTTWAPEATLAAADAAAFEYLGWSIAPSSDAGMLVAGMVNDTTASAALAGSARVFLRGTTGWSEDAALLAADGAGSDGLGWSVALAADGRRALIGVPYDDLPGATDGGTARVFRIAGTLPSGASCTSDAVCLSGFCTDGVCCASRCGGGAEDCQACSAALNGGLDGTCAPLSIAVAPTVTCRAAVGACDTTEVCSGTSAECPADAYVASGAVCRASSGACDVAEVCSGAGAACPADVVASAGASCRAPAGPCDVPEVCDGRSGACPSDAFFPSSQECRTAFGGCDVSDFCTGSSPDCIDRYALPGTLCRGARSECDVDEMCDGLTAACPPDAFAPSSRECGGPVSGACDAPDRCAGTSADCVASFAAPGTTCRPAIDLCDAEELCTGFETACPIDRAAPAGVVCRAPTMAGCDPAEACDGASLACPSDVTMCGGIDAGSESDAGSEADAGSEPDAGARDGGGRVDAGSVSVDAGGVGAAAGGCSCRTAARGHFGPGALGVLAVLGVLARRRRPR